MNYFYSEYGYVQVKKDEYENTDNCLLDIYNSNRKICGKVKRSCLQSFILINLKTLYGERIVHPYKVNINDKISILIDKLLERESNEKDESKKWHKNSQYRLMSTQGMIKELMPTKTFMEENVKNNCNLILVSPIKLVFSPTQHGPGIVLDSTGSLAYKQNGDELQYALASRGFSSGRHYCQFTLDTEPDERNIIVGVTLSRLDFNFAADSKNFWGYVPSE